MTESHYSWLSSNCTFVFQEEDGIRDGHVTGVQTCALPICPQPSFERLEAVQELIFPPVGKASSTGPIQLEGHLNVYRQKVDEEYAKLLVITSNTRN